MFNATTTTRLNNRNAASLLLSSLTMEWTLPRAHYSSRPWSMPSGTFAGSHVKTPLWFPITSPASHASTTSELDLRCALSSRHCVHVKTLAASSMLHPVHEVAYVPSGMLAAFGTSGAFCKARKQARGMWWGGGEGALENERMVI